MKKITAGILTAALYRTRTATSAVIMTGGVTAAQDRTQERLYKNADGICDYYEDGNCPADSDGDGTCDYRENISGTASAADGTYGCGNGWHHSSGCGNGSAHGYGHGHGCR